MRRKMHLITSLILEDEAIQFLKNLHSNTDRLNQLIVEITNAIRDTNHEMIEQWGLIESTQEEALDMDDFRTLYECVDMAREDHASSLCELRGLEAQIDGKSISTLPSSIMYTNYKLTFGVTIIIIFVLY